MCAEISTVCRSVVLPCFAHIYLRLLDSDPLRSRDIGLTKVQFFFLTLAKVPVFRLVAPWSIQDSSWLKRSQKQILQSSLNHGVTDLMHCCISCWHPHNEMSQKIQKMQKHNITKRKWWQASALGTEGHGGFPSSDSTLHSWALLCMVST